MAEGSESAGANPQTDVADESACAREARAHMGSVGYVGPCMCVCVCERG